MPIYETLLRLLKRSKGLVGFTILALVWSVISFFDLANRFWFASISEILIAIKTIGAQQTEHVLATFSLVFVGLIGSSVLGVLFGIVLGLFKSVHQSLRPSIDFWRSIPPIIVIPILYRWNPLDDDFLWRVLLILFGCIPILTVVISDSIISSNEKRLSGYESFQPSILFKFQYVIVYEILPAMFTGLRTIVSFSIIIAVVSEMVLGPSHGIGRQIIHYQSAFEIQFVYAFAIIVGLIGLLLNRAIRLIEKAVITWDR